jgi:1,2-diacylglycerol 3-beta-galactosyltransferase
MAISARPGIGSPAAASTETAPRRTAPRDLLFLVADTGGGHRASAMAVAHCLATSEPERWSVHVLDPFADAAPAVVGRVVALYSPLIRHAPWLWGALFRATNSRAAVTTLRRTVLRLVEPGLDDVITTLQPAAVVSFHPLLNHPAAHVLHRRPGPAIPVITVVTDLVDVHAAWTYAGVDALVTGSPSALDACRRAGVAAERCFDLGLPVDARFLRQAAPARSHLRQRLGLDRDRFLVLLSGGGEGSGGLGRRAAALLEAGLDLQVAVICGRNLRLRRRLEALALGSRLVVAGFVDNMADWMGAADLVVTKAGPGAITEALACQVPLLLTSYLPGQERGNVDLVVGLGAGRYVPGIRDLVGAVAELSVPGSPALAAMRAALPHAARPHATAQIAGLVSRLARGHG